MANSLSALSQEITTLAEAVSQSVVAIHARPRFHSSGVHWGNGLIVTAEHALRTDEDVRVTRASETYTAEVVGRDPGTDLAILRVKGDHSLPTLDQATNGSLVPGNLVIAVGRNTESANVELGVISSIGGPSRSRRGGKLDSVIRLDLSLHPVSTGGAVVTADGKFIGIATPALSQVAVFAVPSATIQRVTDAIVQHGAVPQGYLGAGLQPVEVPDHLKEQVPSSGRTGLMTISVDKDAPAGNAGLLIGDVLLDWNGIALDRLETLRSLLGDSIGKSATVRVLRGGEVRTMEITAAERKPSQK